MLHILFILVLIGILLYCVNQFIPMDATIKKIINIVVVICVVFWLLNVFGVFGVDIPVPQVHHYKH